MHDTGLLPTIPAVYEHEPDVLPVEMVFDGEGARLPREGRADAALLYTPADQLRGPATEALLTEAPVAVLPAPPTVLLLAWPTHSRPPPAPQPSHGRRIRLIGDHGVTTEQAHSAGRVPTAIDDTQ